MHVKCALPLITTRKVMKDMILENYYPEDEFKISVDTFYTLKVKYQIQYDTIRRLCLSICPCIIG